MTLIDDGFKTQLLQIHDIRNNVRVSERYKTYAHVPYDITIEQDHIREELVYRFHALLAGSAPQTCTDTVVVPSTWWDAFKVAYRVTWWMTRLRRWRRVKPPVMTTHVLTTEAKLLFPDIAQPFRDNTRHIKIAYSETTTSRGAAWPTT